MQYMNGRYAHFLLPKFIGYIMTTFAKLEPMLAPAIEVLGFELVDCALTNEAGRAILRIYIDSEQGVRLEDCQKVSEQISAILDVEAPLSGRYNLEISSPGLDRPLVTLAHYQRFIGRQIRLKLHRAVEGRRNFSGELLAVVGNSIQMRLEDQVMDFPLDNIEKANLVPELRF